MNDAREQEVARLRARVDRERRARRQAEVIAEQEMRELWLLQRRSEATLAYELAARAIAVGALRIERVHRHAMADEIVVGLAARASRGDRLSAELDTLRTLLVVEQSNEVAARDFGPRRLADELVERWQRLAARRGQLLILSFVGDDAPRPGEWHRFVAAANIVLRCFSEIGSPGELSVTVAARCEAVELVVSGSIGPTTQQPGDGVPCPTLETEVEVARRILADAGGGAALDADADGIVTVSARLPMPT